LMSLPGLGLVPGAVGTARVDVVSHGLLARALVMRNSTWSDV
jgi:hypothetical protein